MHLLDYKKKEKKKKLIRIKTRKKERKKKLATNKDEAGLTSERQNTSLPFS